MQQIYDMGVRILFFCGGETFLWKDGERTLRDLVIEAKSMGFLIVNVVTNGTFPIDLPEADLILLSLDGDKQRQRSHLHSKMNMTGYCRLQSVKTLDCMFISLSAKASATFALIAKCGIPLNCVIDT